MRIAMTVAAIIGGFAGLAAAADGPSFDCAKAESGAEKLVCSDDALAEIDLRLAETFKAAVAVLEGVDAGGDAALAELRATQRGWIKGRDECWKAADERACVEDAYLGREGELVALYMLREPTAIVRFECAGNPANEVYASFFDTERPSVRLERGDSVEGAVLMPAASGAKYEASFGKSLWVKGDAATLVWPQGETVQCVAAE